MKKRLFYTLVLVAGLILISSSFKTVYSQTTKKKDAILVKTPKYTCTMHPEVTKNNPGNCPKCGMALVLQGDAKPGDMHAYPDSAHRNMNQDIHDTSKWKKGNLKPGNMQDTARWKKGDLKREKSGTNSDSKSMKKDTTRWKKDATKRNSMRDPMDTTKRRINTPQTAPHNP